MLFGAVCVNMLSLRRLPVQKFKHYHATRATEAEPRCIGVIDRRAEVPERYPMQHIARSGHGFMSELCAPPG